MLLSEAFMDSRFLIHNSHLESATEFAKLDPNLRQLARQPLVHVSDILTRLPVDKPGIYSITGGRQIGKTTLLKQWMAKLLDTGIAPERIAFFTGELIDDHHALTRLITEHLEAQKGTDAWYLLLDEVTYIKDWDKGIKFLADAGILENVVMVITGSDISIIKEARMRFPGRRGVEDVVDFHLYPLNFKEVVALKKTLSDEEREAIKNGAEEASVIEKLFSAFDDYLMHGGFLTAINDFQREQKINPSTFAVYSDWIRGDVLKRGKSERYLLEILNAVIKRQGSQITWNNLAQDLSIDHPKTVADYILLLSNMDVLFIQPALLEDKLAEAPKKPRKLHFADPFIRHAVKSWIDRCKDPFSEQVSQLLKDSESVSTLVEGCAVSHVRRLYQTFYIKAEGEVDIAYLDGGKFWPIEIKWTNQLRPKEIKQALKYKNSRILTRLRSKGVISGMPAEPLPLVLFREFS